MDEQDFGGTEAYPADHEIVDDPESLAGDDCDDWFLDEDGNGIDDRLEDEEGDE